MKALMSRFRDLCGQALDISEHLGLLRGLACDPDVGLIVEIGFRTGVSATALASSGKRLFCVDVEPCRDAVRKLKELAPKFEFIHGDSLKAAIPNCDLLHIDSLHTYSHLRQELRLHARKSSKWIVLHDTATFGKKGKDESTPGLLAAVAEFLEQEGREWRLILNLMNNNGLMILQRHRAS